MASEGPRRTAYLNDVLVIGGGLFGCVLALHWAKAGRRVALVEQGSRLLNAASTNNQARVHVGYHYPRSQLTALRSRVNSERFEHDYGPCIDRSSDSVYAIARHFSQVTASQFQAACERIRAPLSCAPPQVRQLFDPERIEAVFSVREGFFDARHLARLLLSRLHDAGVTCYFDTRAEQLTQDPASGIVARCLCPSGQQLRFLAERVYACTYAASNRLLAASGLPPLALKHELAELVLVRPPEQLQRLAVTVMCGPFFSLTPVPGAGLHTLSHVRYTPHTTWYDHELHAPVDREAALGALPRSAAPAMLRDAARYLPAASRCRAVNSIWEVKTLLPRNELDDGRPILFRHDHGLRGLTCVLGAKLDNVYDALAELTPSEERRSA